MWQRSAKFARTPAGRPAQVHGRSTAQTSNGTTAVPGPQGAFADGTKGQARQTLFNTIAPVYDELNERLSFGRHWGWKRDAVRRSGAAPGDRALDVCCGSGDLTYLLADAVGQQGSVVGFDFAQDMLDYAVQRGHPKPSRNCAPADIEWLQGDAMQLPFGNASFDAATMGYGLRNIADPSKALQELHRVLRPGATAAILDFNNCPDPIVDGLQVRNAGVSALLVSCGVLCARMGVVLLHQMLTLRCCLLPGLPSC